MLLRNLGGALLENVKNRCLEAGPRACANVPAAAPKRKYQTPRPSPPKGVALCRQCVNRRWPERYGRSQKMYGAWQTNTCANPAPPRIEQGSCGRQKQTNTRAKAPDPKHTHATKHLYSARQTASMKRPMVNSNLPSLFSQQLLCTGRKRRHLWPPPEAHQNCTKTRKSAKNFLNPSL